ncbi:MAG: response regulator [Salinimicrobium sediminis]|uniref:cAMP-binding domain of CRP or a regulatory subunit of cAMP-dependent protein kinases n=1 Tax=Salinimicrobium sediminis TaxID=1343891 RepID=A0A285X714_9FLAO|nr:response regulator [Salinimicrobium sediminis]MDX1601757.1 response regulator [Salinimicrobium sediminis]SOC81147.1 cAMP-binding domain of CRP or a regulatory subunit of cAMP-dependent protein kinases [Salinimicrobium sediminis]
MEKVILLIEDDQILAENTKELLELSGYNVITSPDGKCGFNKALTQEPDLIISDIMMPHLDGYQVYEALQQHQKTAKIPFIFLSARSNLCDIRKGMNLGADDYIPKPFDERDLLVAVEKRLEKKEKLCKEKEATKYSKQNQLEELKKFFRTYGEQQEAEKDEEIFLEGRSASSVYLLEYGLVKTFELDEWGKELITDVCQKGDFIGFYSFKSHSSLPESATALERSILFRISHHDFVDMLKQNHDLSLEFAELLSNHLITLKNHLLEMAYGSVLKKTASTLLEFVKKTNGGLQPLLKVSRGDMASVAGISTESFIRSLSSLKAEGIIDIIGRNIRILDLQKLKNIH